MSTWTEYVFLMGLVCLVLHELDAIQQKEWRFFFRSFLADQTSYRLFVFLHFPLLLWILWALDSTQFQIGMSLFLVIHAGLHWVLRNHPLIQFENSFSRVWIYGGATFGLIHLILLLSR
ncbi:MAG: DUF6713 family protein [Phototrophicaceae bacterium]